MIKGITVNGSHSYYNFGLRMLKRSIGSPPKDEHLERVPYSNITYDFDELFGNTSYGERQLIYQFDLMQRHGRNAEDRLVRIINSLHWKGRKELYDDLLPNYYFEVREPTVTYTEDHGIYKVENNEVKELYTNISDLEVVDTKIYFASDNTGYVVSSWIDETEPESIVDGVLGVSHFVGLPGFCVSEGGNINHNGVDIFTE